MTYWHETMHDDVFLVMNEGWVEAARPRTRIEARTQARFETPDLVVGSRQVTLRSTRWTSSRPPLIVARYFADEQAELDDAASPLDAARRRWRSTSRSTPSRTACWRTPLVTTARSPRSSSPIGSRTLKGRVGPTRRDRGGCSDARSCSKPKRRRRRQLKDAQAELDARPSRSTASSLRTDVKQLVLDDKWMRPRRAQTLAQSDAANDSSRADRIELLGRLAMPKRLGDLRGTG